MLRAWNSFVVVMLSLAGCAVDTLELAETEQELSYRLPPDIIFVAPVALTPNALWPTQPTEDATAEQYFRIDNKTDVARSGWVAAQITPADGSPAYVSEWWRIDNLPANGWQYGLVRFTAPQAAAGHGLQLFYFESTTWAGEFLAPGTKLAWTNSTFTTVHASNLCNGAHALCHRRFDTVTFPSTHNAMSNLADHWVLPNQPYGIAAQLAHGIRGMMIDIDWYEGMVRMCHSSCLGGSRPLLDGLRDIRAFLASHPTEIVTILFEGDVNTLQVADVFATAGLTPYLYAHSTPSWPTLGAMIRSGRRLVVLTHKPASGGTTLPWYMDEWVHAFENDYNDYQDCRPSPFPDRNRQSNALFVFNHFYTPASQIAASAVNPGLLERAQRCQAAFGRRINFLTVDWYTEGDVVGAARALNGL